MPCNTCKLQFTIFKRKRECLSCHQFYCANCLGKRSKNVCIRCEIIRLSSKNELMLLKTKDLVFFLHSRKINISGIVEKEELCNLIINHINSSSYCESIAANSSGATPSEFENYSQNFDQIKQTCQNFFTSITDKIASDFQKTTCFNNQTSQMNRENVTVHQPKPNTQSSSNNLSRFQIPGTSTSGVRDHPNSPKSGNHERKTVNCECCSDEELAEISEKRSSILKSDDNDVWNNAKKLKISDASSESSFEEVGTSASAKHCDDDWQFIENDKTESLIEDKSAQIDPNKVISHESNSNNNMFARRKSDSSILKLKKSRSVNVICNNGEISDIKISCRKCGKSRSKITEEIMTLNEQLKLSNRSEKEISTKIKQFIDYLDTKLEPSNAVNNNDAGPSTSSNHNSENYSNDDSNSELKIDQNNLDDMPSCSFNSAKRFITLDDIQSSTDLEFLSVKQLKELLALNRVDFKGCCEKNELKERVQRLWESYVNTPPSDRLASNDLCKICMDAPIECVFLECGHTATCTACGKILSECPICRSYIVRVVRIFKS